MGLFNNRFTRFINKNRNKTEDKKKSFKYMYEVTAKVRDQGRGMIVIKIKCPANTSKGAREYFEENIYFTIEKIIKDRRNKRRKAHVKSKGSTKY